MKLDKLLYWLFFAIVTVWQAASFVLAIVNRSRSTDACEQANPSGNATTSGNSTAQGFLGVSIGDTYGLANCSQAVEVGLIAIAVLLFVGTLFMVSGCDWHDVQYLVQLDSNLFFSIDLFWNGYFLVLPTPPRATARPSFERSFGLGRKRHGPYQRIS
jgi:hypothetical protein